MRIVRTLMTMALVLALAAPGFAQAQAQPPAAAPTQSVPPPSGKALVYSGAAVFTGGMATALYGFIRVDNGKYSTFGEATSRNKPLGAAGLAAAFAGGTMMFLGTRVQRYAPSVAVTHEGLAVEKTITW